MASVRSVVLATFVVLLAMGCRKKNPEPAHLVLSDFDSVKQLRDTLEQRFPPGSSVSRVWEHLQVHGFLCGERGGAPVGGKTLGLFGDSFGDGPKQPQLQCWASNRRGPFVKRHWIVWFPFDSARLTTAVYANDLARAPAAPRGRGR